MNNPKLIGIVFGAALLAGAVVFLLTRTATDRTWTATGFFGFLKFPPPGGLTPHLTSPAEGGGTLPPAGGEEGLREGEGIQYEGRFTHPSLGFSFEIPPALRATTIEDERGEVILVEGAGGGFQIFIVPFDEEGPLSPARIRKDLPQMVMKNIRNARIDLRPPHLTSPAEGGGTFPPTGGEGLREGGVPAIVFESEDPYLGPTFEVWFAYPESPHPHGNYLYQITGMAEFAQDLAEILNTWKFE